MAKKTWRGSRFAKNAHPKADTFLSSIEFDKELFEHDIKGSIAHARMLGKSGIIDKRESSVLVKGLNALLKKYGNGKISKSGIRLGAAEDVHALVAGLLEKEVGKEAKRLHAARSRNDQIALDEKLYCKDSITAICSAIKALQAAFLQVSRKYADVVMPAYTHLQQAQCVSFAHYMLAYAEMLERDSARLKNAYRLLDRLPLGSCALSGTSLPIDRRYVAKLLNFSGVSRNSIDSVSDRDFIIEILSALAILGMHLSRLSEDFIIWSTKEFSFLVVDEAFCTGSSIMPHKKNPDVLEYIRGYAGRLYGNLVSLLTTMKGLPLAYNRDMQHDKEALFGSVRIAGQMLDVLADLCKRIEIRKEKIEEALDKDPGLYSVDMVEYLVKKGRSYEEAHDATGKIMRDWYARGKTVREIKLEKPDLKAYDKLLEKDIYNKTFDPVKSVNLKTSYGGTSFNNVKNQLANLAKGIRACTSSDIKTMNYTAKT